MTAAIEDVLSPDQFLAGFSQWILYAELLSRTIPLAETEAEILDARLEAEPGEEESDAEEKYLTVNAHNIQVLLEAYCPDIEEVTDCALVSRGDDKEVLDLLYRIRQLYFEVQETHQQDETGYMHSPSMLRIDTVMQDSPYSVANAVENTRIQTPVTGMSRQVSALFVALRSGDIGHTTRREEDPLVVKDTEIDRLTQLLAQAEQRQAEMVDQHTLELDEAVKDATQGAWEEASKYQSLYEACDRERVELRVALSTAQTDLERERQSLKDSQDACALLQSKLASTTATLDDTSRQLEHRTSEIQSETSVVHINLETETAEKESVDRESVSEEETLTDSVQEEEGGLATVLGELERAKLALLRENSHGTQLAVSLATQKERYDASRTEYYALHSTLDHMVVAVSRAIKCCFRPSHVPVSVMQPPSVSQIQPWLDGVRSALSLLHEKAVCAKPEANAPIVKPKTMRRQLKRTYTVKGDYSLLKGRHSGARTHKGPLPSQAWPSTATISSACNTDPAPKSSGPLPSPRARRQPFTGGMVRHQTMVAMGGRSKRPRRMSALGSLRTDAFGFKTSEAREGVDESEGEGERDGTMYRKMGIAQSEREVVSARVAKESDGEVSTAVFTGDSRALRGVPSIVVEDVDASSGDGESVVRPLGVRESMPVIAEVVAESGKEAISPVDSAASAEVRSGAVRAPESDDDRESEREEERETKTGERQDTSITTVETQEGTGIIDSERPAVDAAIAAERMRERAVIAERDMEREREREREAAKTAALTAQIESLADALFSLQRKWGVEVAGRSTTELPPRARAGVSSVPGSPQHWPNARGAEAMAVLIDLSAIPVSRGVRGAVRRLFSCGRRRIRE
ncbi:hypothetical protein KIPB_001204 [Kipferlia bialata]|uniref:Uncharacterized protein n=1 Tax=Kipferlia bialata TaxID=797122 RepID=A0A9K3CQC5_9EUKA|nr:hypothetical protein KIPB_001204 [Kipferlia bialata]|eukprot:g1204.t1